MAIEYTLLLKNKKLSKEILVKKIESLGFSCHEVELLEKGLCINLNEEIGFAVFLLDVGDYPYNSWETKFLTNDFILERTLGFRMDKEFVKFERQYNAMLKIMFELVSELNEEAILVGNGNIELCYFRENKPILLNNESGIWSRACFKDIIVNSDVCYM